MDCIEQGTISVQPFSKWVLFSALFPLRRDVMLLLLEIDMLRALTLKSMKQQFVVFNFNV